MLCLTVLYFWRFNVSTHSGDSSTQRPTWPSLPSIRSFTWQGLETSSWLSSRALDRPIPQWHRICSCQPLETDRQTGILHGGATRRPELATRWPRPLFLSLPIIHFTFLSFFNVL